METLPLLVWILTVAHVQQPTVIDLDVKAAARFFFQLYPIIC